MKSNEYLKALEADQSGNWNLAHNIVQDDSSSNGAWIHAYLHRKEGDQWNAEYWYRRAVKPVFKGTLEEEWAQLWSYFSE
ncbi:MAG: hypothetical protein JXQ90_00640 [Cyclobacteriaceae bacterium]